MLSKYLLLVLVVLTQRIGLSSHTKVVPRRSDREKPKSCLLLPIANFKKCLESHAANIDDVVGLLPTNRVGKYFCDSINFLTSSSAPQGQDIKMPEDPETWRLGVLCGNGEIFLRMTTESNGSHWSILELMVRSGNWFVPIRISEKSSGGILFQINPRVDVTHGKRTGQKSCTECHGLPPPILWDPYPSWRNSLAGQQDILMDKKGYREFLDHFLRRKEGRFLAIQNKLKSYRDTTLPPYSDGTTQFVAKHKPNLVLTQFVAQTTADVLAEQVFRSPILFELPNTTLLLFTRGCMDDRFAPRRSERFVNEVFPRLRKLAKIAKLDSFGIKGDSALEMHVLARYWLNSIYPELISRRKKEDLVSHLEYNTGLFSLRYEDELAGGPLELGDYFVARLLERMARQDPKLKPFLEGQNKLGPLNKHYQTKETETGEVWDSVNALSDGFLSAKKQELLCEYTIRLARKELDLFLAKIKTSSNYETLRSRSASPPSEMIKKESFSLLSLSCAECHSTEISVPFLGDPKNAWWLAEGISRVASGDMPREQMLPRNLRDKLLKALEAW